LALEVLRMLVELLMEATQLLEALLLLRGQMPEELVV
jgi:hypothetical protein